MKIIKYAIGLVLLFVLALNVVKAHESIEAWQGFYGDQARKKTIIDTINTQAAYEKISTLNNDGDYIAALNLAKKVVTIQGVERAACE